ncbi:hypothetical protein BDN70DRAFT_883645 [Pholiota conissans]|uniref:Uncharacterized protein n=1 Tax=Pholiota conissans TaxID=109636 RepID=A0A9P5YX48_9AGAR|nr:hypothetical protein BDN70DRAFT_883645 [Pholiota conissans]
MVLILGDTPATYLAIEGLSQPCLSVAALPTDVSSSFSFPAATHSSVTYSIPGGACTEIVSFAVVEDSPADVLVGVTWLLERGINSASPREDSICSFVSQLNDDIVIINDNINDILHSYSCSVQCSSSLYPSCFCRVS